uniref:Uncharacterized protein n=1 Tax=Arundo donax TaxID=35708 RepID=A0A0A9H5B6_ARUDO
MQHMQLAEQCHNSVLNDGLPDLYHYMWHSFRSTFYVFSCGSTISCKPRYGKFC